MDEEREIWLQRIIDCNASGMAKKKWCASNGVNASRFYQWLRTFRDEDPDFDRKVEGELPWMELELPAAPAAEASFKEAPRDASQSGTDQPMQYTAKADRRAVIEIGSAKISVPLGIEGTDILGILEAVSAL